MKKLLALVLAGTMCVGMLAGCGGNKTDDTPADEPNVTVETEVKPDVGANKPDNTDPTTTSPTDLDADTDKDDSKEEGGYSVSGADAPVMYADINAFEEQVVGEYDFAQMSKVDDEIINQFYPGLLDLKLEQYAIYLPDISSVPYEIAMVQVSDANDISVVQEVFQARIDKQTEEGAFYPDVAQAWANDTRIVVAGTYMMLIVSPDCAAIGNDFMMYINS